MKNYEEVTRDLLERRDRYVTQQKARQKRGLRVVVSLCCMCIVALFGVGVWQSGMFGVTPQIVSPTETIGESNITTTTTIFISEELGFIVNDHTTTTAAPVIIPDKEGALYKYYDYRIEAGIFSSYVNGKVIAEDKLDGELGDVTVMAGWKATDGSWLSEEHLRAELHSITGVATDVAVAIKFLDKGDGVTDTHYYVIMNPEADLSVVEEYIIDSITLNTSGEELEE